MSMSMSNASGRSIFSYKNGNVILAAIVLLLIVTLLVLLLHIYTKWFMAQARRRRSRHSASGPNRLHTLTLETAASADKGLDASVIASIPLFVHAKQDGQDQECVICLSGYEEGDVGRRLSSSCGHTFHVECIDMWLRSHSGCPLCRAPVVVVVAPRSDGSVMELDITVDNVQDDDFAPSEDVGVGGDGVATTTSMGASLKRMMSCGNKSGRKVHPSASSSSDSNV